MPVLELEGLTKCFDGVVAVQGVSLTVDAGEFVSLLGASGSGKSTILRLVAGLEVPDAGTIRLYGQVINYVPAKRRGMGLVVQSYALFPHLNVYENVAYGLRLRGLRGTQLASRVRDALALVRLAGMERRYPHQLSGGQQQRVALARALVIEPSILLLDEALGALDKNLREEMQVELKELQRKVGVTTLYVTHDQEEALSLSDRIVLLRDGRVEQVGTPSEVYDQPRTEFVARFLGDANVIPCTLLSRRPETAAVRVGDRVFPCPEPPAGISPGDGALLVVRPERVGLAPWDGMDLPESAWPGRIHSIMYRGAHAKVLVEGGALGQVTVYVTGMQAEQLPPGMPVTLQWPPEAVAVVPDGGDGA